LVKGAVRAVALKANTNVRALARIIEAVLGGSMLAWNRIGVWLRRVEALRRAA
jgi:hypothetical protein